MVASPGSAPRSPPSPVAWRSRPVAGGERSGRRADPAPAAAELARFLPEVEAVTIAELAEQVAPQRVAGQAVRVAADADWLFLGASPDGRDVAGIARRPARLGRPGQRHRRSAGRTAARSSR